MTFATPSGEHVLNPQDPFAPHPHCISAPDGAEWAPTPIVISDLHYRQDGAGFLDLEYQQIFVVSAEGGTPRQLTRGPYDHRGRLAAGIRVAKTGVKGYWLEFYVDKSDDAVVELARNYATLKHDAKGTWEGGRLPFKDPCPDRTKKTKQP